MNTEHIDSICLGRIRRYIWCRFQWNQHM